MCLFSRPVEAVSRTRIFARGLPEGRQLLVIGTVLQSRQPTALIVPLPVSRRRGPPPEFLDLTPIPGFLDDLASLWPNAPAGSAAAPLELVEVGPFIASYVPTADAFAQLDSAFRLPAAVRERLPGADRRGFAVFQLQPGEQDVLPMALHFASARPGRLFFPTAQMHGDKWLRRTRYQHTLYAQADDMWATAWLDSWEPCAEPVGTRVPGDARDLLLDRSLPVWRKRLAGRRPNEDLWV